MNAYYAVSLVGFLVVVAILLIRYVNAMVDRQFRSLARAQEDGEYRRGEIARLDGLLDGATPLPAAVVALPKRGSGIGPIFPSILLTVGIVLLWGGGAIREGRDLWLFGGFVAVGLAVLIMLATLRRRKWARIAGLLLFRADLKRMDGDRAGAAADLRELLRLTPWDDSAWAELGDDLAASADLDGAIRALEEASAIDPKCDDYYMMLMSLAIRRGRFDRARQAMDSWRTLGGADDDDPRLAVYAAALKLGEGKSEEAKDALRDVLHDHDPEEWDFLDSDDALAGVKSLLPGRADKHD